MSVAANLYIPGDSMDVSAVLSRAGFGITASHRKLPDGSQAPVYCVTQGSATVSLSILPIPKDPRHVYLMLLAKPRFTSTLSAVSAALEAEGALTSEQYVATPTI